LELLVVPAAKAMGSTAGNGYDGPGFPRGFMNLCGDIKIGKGIVYLSGSINVDAIFLGDEANLIDGGCSFIRLQLLVCIGIEEVIGEDVFDVLFIFDDAWPKVFI
jgi:hypothetical protein